MNRLDKGAKGQKLILVAMRPLACSLLSLLLLLLILKLIWIHTLMGFTCCLRSKQTKNRAAMLVDPVILNVCYGRLLSHKDCPFK